MSGQIRLPRLPQLGWAPQDMFWNARLGTLTDKFGIGWMFNFDKSGGAK